MSLEKPEPVLILEVEPRGNISMVIKLQVGQVGNGMPQHFTEGEYANLALRALGNKGTAGNQFYGAQIGYWDVFSVNLDTARRMVKTLGQIQHRMKKLEEQLGYADDVPALAGRFAAAVGAKRAFYNYRKEEWADDTHWREGYIGDLISYIRNLEYEIAHPEQKT